MLHPTPPFHPGQEYVLGFAFTPSKKAVLLIKKTRPKWQAGKLNGVGGKVEPGEFDLAQAMVREFEEETAVKTDPLQWSMFGQHVLQATFDRDPQSYHLYLFSTVLTEAQTMQIEAPTDEEPLWFAVCYLGTLAEGETNEDYKVQGVGGVSMYALMALNHMGRSFHTMTIETP